MIRVILNGRLGNQMFQYAFGLVTAKNLGTKLQMVTKDFEDEVQQFFTVPADSFGLKSTSIHEWIFRQSARLGWVKKKTENVEQFIDDRYNYSIYDGYFQNESYFAGEMEMIRQLFSIQPKWKADFDNIKNDFDFENSIVIHVRLKDYLTWNIEGLGGADLSLPKTYYTNAIKALGSTLDAPFIIVSDDIDLAMQRLDFLRNPTFINYTPQIRFQALMQARRLIISNSTFAWWGAYLNPNNPTVMAPKHWLGFKVKKDYPYGILPTAFAPVAF